jgi:circadian clock protein KaiC
MNSIEKISTGVPGFDYLTHGGIPKGRATLVTGKSGTCKTVLSLQISF